jgi:L-asparaginase
MAPVLVIHGGCGKFESASIGLEEYRSRLGEIVADGFDRLRDGDSADDVVMHVIRLLEDEDIFNSGTGSKLQRDGRARMSAAFMNGREARFSAVINVERVQHPIDLARRLSGEQHTVLAGEPATKYAREQDFLPYNPVTPYREAEHRERIEGETGTCGAVVLDSDGLICVGTSTGGIGYEVPGRVGDSPTVAGTYAREKCGVSCTGVGEHIVNEAVAAQTVTLVSGGMSLEAAVHEVVQRGNQCGYRYGLISLDSSGKIAVGQTDGVTTLFACASNDGACTFLDRSASKYVVESGS